MPITTQATRLCRMCPCRFQPTKQNQLDCNTECHKAFAALIRQLGYAAYQDQGGAEHFRGPCPHHEREPARRPAL